MKKPIALLLIGISTVALAGEREGGGGNLLSAEFVKTGHQAIVFVTDGDRLLDNATIMNAISKTKVIPVDEICYTDLTTGKKYCEDAHYDAVNNVILFAFKNWDKMICKEKLLLASHEFLRVAGHEGEDYGYSGRFLDNSVERCRNNTEQGCADNIGRMARRIQIFCEYMQLLVNERKSNR